MVVDEEAAIVITAGNGLIMIVILFDRTLPQLFVLIQLYIPDCVAVYEYDIALVILFPFNFH